MAKTILRMSPLDVLRRGHYGYHFYWWIYGLVSDWRIARRSMSATVLTEHDGANPAQSISYPYLQELLKHLPEQEGEVFVDVGCAWGRLIGYLRKKTAISRYIGVELNAEVAAMAQETFRDCPEVTILSGDILTELPAEGTLFYLFNPFSGEILREFLLRAEQTLTHSIRLMYLHPVYHQEIDSRPGWVLQEKQLLKPMHLGALELYIYTYTPSGT